MEFDYNPLRLHSQPYTITLTHPGTPTIPETYSIRPPCLRCHIRGDAAWVRWWRSCIQVQSQVALPLLTIKDEVYHVPTSYMFTTLIHGLDAGNTFLTNINHNNGNFKLTNTTLKPAPDGSHIITKKQLHHPHQFHHLYGRRAGLCHARHPGGPHPHPTAHPHLHPRYHTPTSSSYSVQSTLR
jgi:hypothetical protein